MRHDPETVFITQTFRLEWTIHDLGETLAFGRPDDAAGILLAWARSVRRYYNSHCNPWSEQCQVLCDELAEQEREIVAKLLAPLVKALREPPPTDSEKQPETCHPTLRSLREASGHTIADVDRALGLEQSCIEDVENGKRRLSADHVFRLSGVYHCSTQSIVAAVNNQTKGNEDAE